jgi:hypothetical protein
VAPQRLTNEMEKEAERHLRQVAATLPQDLSVTTMRRHGDPAEQISGARSRAAGRPDLHGRLRPGARVPAMIQAGSSA